MNPIAIVPTYNERKNIRELIETIIQEAPHPNLHILVVDSASPDGTAKTVRSLQKDYPFLHLLCQEAKLGLGRAYLDGMKWALERPYDCVITMDADFSHHPRYLKNFLESAKDHDLVVGCRYIRGGELCNWPWHRRFLSRFANGYAHFMTGLPLHDLTSGFHCFRSDLLKKILAGKIMTEGYAFLIELKHQAILKGASFEEIPIRFNDRTKGQSKISKRVILESMIFVCRLFFQRNRVRQAVRQASSTSTQVMAY